MDNPPLFLLPWTGTAFITLFDSQKPTLTLAATWFSFLNQVKASDGHGKGIALPLFFVAVNLLRQIVTDHK